MLIGYDGHTIYYVYIKDQKKIIKIKDFYIFNNFKIKVSIELFDYNNELIFQGIFYKNNNKRLKELSNIYAIG